MKRLLAIAGLLLVFGVLPAMAESEAEIKARINALKPADFPTQPIEFVVVYPAGGGMDVTARLLAKYVEKYTEQRIIVLNKVGGAGLVGNAYVATQAKADGYTVGVLSDGSWTDALLKAPGKWTQKNFQPLAYLNYEPRTWIVSTSGPFANKSTREIVEHAKQNPGKVKVAITPGLSGEWLAEQIEGLSGAKLIKVPFQGGAPAITALLGGHIDVAGVYYSEYQGHLAAGKVRVIGVASDRRLASMPQVPTLNEALGAKDLVWEVWRYAATPRGAPEERRKYLAAALEAALRDPGLIAEYAKKGAITERKYASVDEVEAAMDLLYERARNFFAKTGRLK
ncbi:MAG: tripartite tricarboxylate transporter substrate binding protein [Candidatus Lambdaproteobacteria bacterium]|nr:tripartite tricarboxylate transporter substrate binding protein [Candidatus Lambdaproteobacteria bacterium]